MFNSPLLSRLIFGDAPDGSPIASVLAKATFILTGNGMLAPSSEDQVIPFWEHPILESGENALLSPVRHASDLVAYQPYCNVVVHGDACAPTGKRARFFEMGLSVGGHIRKIRVTGKRTIDASNGHIKFTDPEAFDRISLSLTNAYGGQDALSSPEKVTLYPYNPFGKGFWLNPEPTALHGQELPNLEDPARLLDPGNILLRNPDQMAEIPRPAHLGECPQVRDELPGLIIPYLRGNESITLAYMDPEHPQYLIHLPKVAPILGLDFGQGITWLEAQLQKIEIDKNKGTITLLWRGSCFCAPLEDLQDCPVMEIYAKLAGVGNA